MSSSHSAEHNIISGILDVLRTMVIAVNSVIPSSDPTETICVAYIAIKLKTVIPSATHGATIQAIPKVEAAPFHP